VDENANVFIQVENKASSNTTPSSQLAGSMILLDSSDANIAKAPPLRVMSSPFPRPLRLPWLLERKLLPDTPEVAAAWATTLMLTYLAT
jgi:hypothetical protein